MDNNPIRKTRRGALSPDEVYHLPSVGFAVVVDIADCNGGGGSFRFPGLLPLRSRDRGTHIVEPMSRKLYDLSSQCPDPRPKTGMALIQPTTGLREIVAVSLAEG
jgi:hypothetical protein